MHDTDKPVLLTDKPGSVTDRPVARWVNLGSVTRVGSYKQVGTWVRSAIRGHKLTQIC